MSESYLKFECFEQILLDEAKKEEKTRCGKIIRHFIIAVIIIKFIQYYGCQSWQYFFRNHSNENERRMICFSAVANIILRMVELFWSQIFFTLYLFLLCTTGIISHKTALSWDFGYIYLRVVLFKCSHQRYLLAQHPQFTVVTCSRLLVLQPSTVINVYSKLSERVLLDC